MPVADSEGLERQIQEDFSAGAIRSVARHLIPENGAYDLSNFLLDDDGSAYGRGGTVNVTDTNFGIQPETGLVNCLRNPSVETNLTDLSLSWDA